MSPWTELIQKPQRLPPRRQMCPDEPGAEGKAHGDSKLAVLFNCCNPCQTLRASSLDLHLRACEERNHRQVSNVCVEVSRSVKISVQKKGKKAAST